MSYTLKPSTSKDSIRLKTNAKSVVTIDSTGTLTAVGVGTATITATATSGVTDSFTIKVTSNEVEVKEDDDIEEIDIEEDVIEEKASSIDDDDDDDDTSAATSTATSTASSSSASVSATAIELKHTSVTLTIGETYDITYSLSPSTSTDGVTFKSYSSSIAKVNSNGTVTAVSEGSTRIVVKADSGVYKKLTVIVVSDTNAVEDANATQETIVKEYDDNGVLLASKVVLTDESISLQKGDRYCISGRVYPSGSTFTISYSSSDPSVAKVTKGGNIVGVSEGNCVVTVSTDNGKYDEIYVTVYGDVISGIDVSKWNGTINWKKVKASGQVDFVMIRASYGSEDIDPMLATNVAGCEKYDIPYGFYHYTYATTVSEARKEAKYFLKAIKNYSPTYPVVLDIEESFYKNMSKSKVTAIIQAFMEELEDAGYYAMIYSYAKFFDDCVYVDEISDYDVWVACWGTQDKLDENYSYHYGMWQYSETGTISGIPEAVDLDYSYKDYAYIIKKNGLNGT